MAYEIHQRKDFIRLITDNTIKTYCSECEKYTNIREYKV